MRTKGRQRRYALEHLYVIEEIKRLKTEGLSLDDIQTQLNIRLNGEQAAGANQNKIDLLANRVAEVVKSVVQSFFEKEKSR
jgi:DNA-binding transcriptional MerR regulator